MTFKDRPIWNFIPDFKSPQSGMVSDVQTIDVGFGNETIWSIEPWIQNTFTMNLLIDQREQIKQIDDFFDSVKGRLEGFWCPTFKGDLRLKYSAEIGNQYLRIEKNGFFEDFLRHPGYKYIALVSNGVIEPLEILSVDSQPDWETLTIGSALLNAYEPGQTQIAFLRYVRFKEDSIEWEYLTDQIAQSEIVFLELTQEYTLQELGINPVYLYRVTQGSNVEYWTSHARNVSAASFLWTSQNIRHTGITRSLDFLDEGVKLVIHTRLGSHLFRSYLSGTPPLPTYVDIYQTFSPTFSLDLAIPIYSAEVKTVSFDSAGKIDLVLTSIMRISEHQIPRFLIQRSCNWRLFDAVTCRVGEATYRNTVIVTVFYENTFTSLEALSFASGWFTLGKAKKGNEVRLIIEHVGDTITLNIPFSNLQVGDEIDITPGCDKNPGTCSSKFGNLLNFGGFPYIPPKNPTLVALTPPTQKKKSGGKF